MIFRDASSDENGQKNLISTSVSIFLAEAGLGSEMRPECAIIRKQTNMVGNSIETVESWNLRWNIAYIYIHKSQSYKKTQ